jgi:hypothetical protein
MCRVVTSGIFLRGLTSWLKIKSHDSAMNFCILSLRRFLRFSEARISPWFSERSYQPSLSSFLNSLHVLPGRARKRVSSRRISNKKGELRSGAPKAPLSVSSNFREAIQDPLESLSEGPFPQNASQNLPDCVGTSPFTFFLRNGQPAVNELSDWILSEGSWGYGLTRTLQSSAGPPGSKQGGPLPQERGR